jgi:hypothetical protein
MDSVFCPRGLHRHGKLRAPALSPGTARTPAARRYRLADVVQALIETDMAKANPKAKPDKIPVRRFESVEETAGGGVDDREEWVCDAANVECERWGVYESVRVRCKLGVAASIGCSLPSGAAVH